MYPVLLTYQVLVPHLHLKKMHNFNTQMNKPYQNLPLFICLSLVSKNAGTVSVGYALKLLQYKTKIFNTFI